MIVLRRAADGETQIVASADGYDMEEWELLNVEPPEAPLAAARLLADGAWVPPPPPRRMTYIESLRLLTTAEIRAALESTIYDVRFAVAMAQGAQFVDLDDPLFVLGLGAFVQHGILTAARAARVLTGLPPA